MEYLKPTKQYSCALTYPNYPVHPNKYCYFTQCDLLVAWESSSVVRKRLWYRRYLALWEMLATLLLLQTSQL